MTLIHNGSRILGFALLLQFLTAFMSMAIILPMATGVQGFGLPEDMGQTMFHLAERAGLVYLNILLELVTAVGVIFLGAVLFSILSKRNEWLALTAFGLYVLEGAMIAVSRLVFFALFSYSRQYLDAGGPPGMEPLGLLLYQAMAYSGSILNFAFCVGATIFYALLFKSGTVARLLALWGLVSVQGVFAGVLMNLFRAEPPVFLYLFYIPFELAIAVWILIRGIKAEAGREA